METETLTNYKSSTEMHLFEKDMDKSHLKNGLHEQNNFGTTEVQDNDEKFVENKSNGPCTKESARDEHFKDIQTEENNKKDDIFDSDVEEEEEHVPLNIEMTSDIEKSDDDLDDTNEQMNIESDKDEEAEILDEDKILDEAKILDEPETLDEAKMDVSEPLNTNDSNDSKINDLSSENISDKQEGQGDNLSKMDEDKPSDNTASNEGTNDFDVLKNDNKVVNNLENATNSQKISETSVQEQNVCKETTEDEFLENDSNKNESEEKSLESENDKDVSKPKSTDNSTKDSEGKTDKSEEQLENKTSIVANQKELKDNTEQMCNKKELKDNTEEKITEKELNSKDEEITDKELKSNSEEINNKKELKDITEGESNEELKTSTEEMGAEKQLKNNTEEMSSKKESKDIVDNIPNVPNEKMSKDTTEIKNTEKEKTMEKPSCPLLMETLTRKDDKEGPNEDDDMDEAYFDPSLLCPDISMEVDEDPVITTNDAPPPPQDGNKSPPLYEPMFSTFVDEMTGAEVSLNLSMDEEALRQETYGEKNPIQLTKIHCTACNVHLGSALDGQGNRFVHPLLKVLICKNCYHFYTSGEFEKDEDGSELYCRWCGQGGQVMCCSNCEMVFCKKCIRINFDRKKLAEIRDSDDWLCFRCNPSQLTLQRIHCAEFMEYVRREISRAATLDNATTFMTTDYSQCCPSQKKKATEIPAGEPKKKKRKLPAEDPDYDPLKDREESGSPQPSTSGYVSIPPKPSTTPKPPNILTMLPAQVQATLNTNPTNPPYKANTPQFKPRVQVVSPSAPNTAQRPKVTGPGYIKILPGGIRVPGNTPTPRVHYANRQIQPTVTQPNPSPITMQPKQPTVVQRPAAPARPQLTPPSMKHEWFEKTVRAAARVNSNLSYTLTQLNRAQSNAQSVEALAVVHNKLQEILSTSINSLIQIRKNLRTEFISGIKNIRFPPASSAAKPTPPAQASAPAPLAVPVHKPPANTDDDVIFISPPTSPVPPPLAQKATLPSQLPQVNLPPSVSITRKPAPNVSIESTAKPNQPAPKPNQPTAKPSQSSNPTPPAAKPPLDFNNDRPKTFLRVKSLTALQNVPSECITIPDDPLPPPPPLTPIQNRGVTKPADVTENTDIVEIIDDNKDDDVKIVNNDDANKRNKSGEPCMTYDLTVPYLHAVKNLKIVIRKSTDLEEMIKKFNQTNCDMSE